MPTRILFVCGRNRWRSPTAEEVFSKNPQLECASAGLSHDAENPITPELLQWADVVFVMERKHRAKLSAQYSEHLSRASVVCLDIPDNYEFMSPELVKLLRLRVGRHLPRT